MDLKELCKIFKSKLLFFVLAAFVGAGIGIATFYFLPKKYYAMGSVFVRRSIYPYAEDHFTYEGYYGQQAAANYTDSIVGLINGVDMQAKYLRDMEIDITEKSLRKISRQIRTKKTGPQVITITTKEDTWDNATKLWSSVTSNTVSVVNGISSTTDPYVGVVKISKDPIIKESYRNLSVFTITGIGIGLIVGLVGVTASIYLNPKKKGNSK